MIISVISQIVRGEEVPINTKGCEEIEIDPANDITAFSFNKNVRCIGISKYLYRLSLKSYKEIKQYLQKSNSVYIR